MMVVFFSSFSHNKDIVLDCFTLLELTRMKTLLFIYNPAAGKAKITSSLGEVTALFQKDDWLVTLYATRAAGDAVEVVQKLGGQYDRIVCSGGDGTLSEVVTGLIHGGLKQPLGYLPAGSTNDFSKTLGLPANLRRAAEVASKGHPFPCDMGQFNDSHIFVYVAAFGLFTKVSYETPQEMKQMLGHAAYILKGIRSLGDVTSYHMTITHDGIVTEGNYIYGMVSNSVSVGGFHSMKNHDVILDDGKFEVLLVETPTSLTELNTVIGAVIARTPNAKVHSFQASRISFHCEKQVAWTLDGEYGGDHTDTQIEILPQMIKVIRGGDTV